MIPYIYVAFYDEELKLRNEYWMDYTKRDERRCLGMRCEDAFADGWSVFTSPVTQYGEIPS